MSGSPLVVLGVDTSMRSTGMGAIEARGNKMCMTFAERVRNPASRPHSASLWHLWRKVDSALGTVQPQAVAIEGLFHFRNSRTALVLGQARGVVLAACAAAGIPVYEYAPRRVKQAVTGTGSADKSQVSHMVTRLLALSQPPPEDVADALAIALCHLQSGTLRTLETRQPI